VAGFVTRPGDRIKSMLLAFLSVRVLGEWLSEPENVAQQHDDNSDFYDDGNRRRRRASDKPFVNDNCDVDDTPTVRS